MSINQSKENAGNVNEEAVANYVVKELNYDDLDFWSEADFDYGNKDEMTVIIDEEMCDISDLMYFHPFDSESVIYVFHQSLKPFRYDEYVTHFLNNEYELYLENYKSVLAKRDLESYKKAKTDFEKLNKDNRLIELVDTILVDMDFSVDSGVISAENNICLEKILDFTRLFMRKAKFNPVYIKDKDEPNEMSIATKYSFDSFGDMVIFFLHKAILKGKKLKKCKGCGKYFFLDSNGFDYCCKLNCCTENGYFDYINKNYREEAKKTHKEIYNMYRLRIGRSPDQIRKEKFKNEYDAFKKENKERKTKMEQNKIPTSDYANWLLNYKDRISKRKTNSKKKLTKC